MLVTQTTAQRDSTKRYKPCHNNTNVWAMRCCMTSALNGSLDRCTSSWRPVPVPKSKTRNVLPYRRDVEFVGFFVGWYNYRNSSGFLKTTKDSATSDQSLMNVRSCHRLVNRLAPLLVNAPALEPFYNLLGSWQPNGYLGTLSCLTNSAKPRVPSVN